jgi:endonuclease YncB( thermonuclease family)
MPRVDPFIFPTGPKHKWLFPAFVYRLYDGDTTVFCMDMGLRMRQVTRVRLALVNSPEMNTPEGPIAAEFTKNWLDSAKAAQPDEEFPFIMLSRSLDNYGRPLGIVWRKDTWECLNKALVDSGNAKRL